jgi:hypothetical protein
MGNQGPKNPALHPEHPINLVKKREGYGANEKVLPPPRFEMRGPKKGEGGCPSLCRTVIFEFRISFAVDRT